MTAATRYISTGRPASSAATITEAVSTTRARRSPLGRLASVAAAVARWVAGPLATATRRAVVAARDALLVAAGITLVACGAWLIAPPAGLIVAGVLLLVWHWALRPDGMVIPVERLVLMLAAARAGLTDEQILDPDAAAQVDE